MQFKNLKLILFTYFIVWCVCVCVINLNFNDTILYAQIRQNDYLFILKFSLFNFILFFFVTNTEKTNKKRVYAMIELQVYQLLFF